VGRRAAGDVGADVAAAADRVAAIGVPRCICLSGVKSDLSMHCGCCVTRCRLTTHRKELPAGISEASCHAELHIWATGLGIVTNESCRPYCPEVARPSLTSTHASASVWLSRVWRWAAAYLLTSTSFGNCRF